MTIPIIYKIAGGLICWVLAYPIFRISGILFRLQYKIFKFGVRIRRQWDRAMFERQGREL